MKKCYLKDYIPILQENISKCGVPLDKSDSYCPFDYCICLVDSMTKERKLFSKQKLPIEIARELQSEARLDIEKIIETKNLY